MGNKCGKETTTEKKKSGENVPLMSNVHLCDCDSWCETELRRGNVGMVLSNSDHFQSER